MVEGGARVAASFVAADLVDEAWLYTSQKRIGADGVAALNGIPFSEITQSPRFRARASEAVGEDILHVYERA
jgi:diaminohydroxyphosphoribosylaminopyrimidine deaminase/5-amino-6-(5-phosphoribosylamino)uracil reductase